MVNSDSPIGISNGTLIISAVAATIKIRKPTICPRCNKNEVRKAGLAYPTEEDFFIDNIYLIGCIPDFPIDRTWGCRNCDAGFWKDTPRNKAALGGLVPHQWPKD